MFILLALILATGAWAPAQTPSAAGVPPAKNDYGKGESWLCRPGRNDACASDLTTTVIAADGRMHEEKFAANPNAPIDCFYVYPTVSNDQTPNSDMTAGPEELSVIRNQFARFGSQCRLYAPLYRQVTLTALRAGLAGRPMQVDRALGYNDVVAAWNYYLENDNKGRGVILIGHSQGSGVLAQLIRNEIAGKPSQKLIVSAMLLGTNLPVPRDKETPGGPFTGMPLCRSASQTGCVISYASFRSDVPPPPNTRFGRVSEKDKEAACTNPAALGGGSGELHAYLASAGRGNGSSAEPKPWVNPPQPVKTPFVSLPGMLTAECVSNEKGSYLAVMVNGKKGGPRTDEIPGDVVANGQVQTDWGLHLIDVNLAMGNLVEIAGKQARAFLKKK